MQDHRRPLIGQIDDKNPIEPDHIQSENRRELEAIIRKSGGIRNPDDMYVYLQEIGLSFRVDQHNGEAGKGGRWKYRAARYRPIIKSLKHVASDLRRARQYQDVEPALKVIDERIEWYESQVASLETLPDGRARRDIQGAVEGLLQIFADFTGQQVSDLKRGSRAHQNGCCEFVAVGLRGLGHDLHHEPVWDRVSDAIKAARGRIS